MPSHTFYNNGIWALQYHYGPNRGSFRYSAVQQKGVHSFNANRMHDGSLVWDNLPPKYIRDIALATSKNVSRKNYVTHNDLVSTFGE